MLFHAAHFNIIAARINEVYNEPGLKPCSDDEPLEYSLKRYGSTVLERFVDKLCVEFDKHNPAFDATRFRQACLRRDT